MSERTSIQTIGVPALIKSFLQSVTAAAAGVGQVVNQDATTTWTLPAGGMWFYFGMKFVGSSWTYAQSNVMGIAAGGTTVYTGSNYVAGFCWRLT